MMCAIEQDAAVAKQVLAYLTVGSDMDFTAYRA